MSADANQITMPHAMDSRLAVLGLTTLGLILLAVLALRFGLRDTGFADVWGSLVAFDPLNARHVVIREIRLPRLVGAILAGASLGMAGALMQGMTRNPLADPGLLGVNAGASLGVVVCIMLLGITDPARFIWVSLGGGLIAALIVFFLGGAGKGSPARLILAGAAVSALFLALSRGLLLISQQTLDVYRFWVLGGFDGVQFSTIWSLAPFFSVGAILAAIATFSLNALILGQDTAKGLGVRVGLAQLLVGLAIVILCGATVAMAGPIAFVGLICAGWLDFQPAWGPAFWFVPICWVVCRSLAAICRLALWPR
jgi:iron complex transport system permease protein